MSKNRLPRRVQIVKVLQISFKEVLNRVVQRLILRVRHVSVLFYAGIAFKAGYLTGAFIKTLKKPPTKPVSFLSALVSTSLRNVLGGVRAQTRKTFMVCFKQTTVKHFREVHPIVGKVYRSSHFTILRKLNPSHGFLIFDWLIDLFWRNWFLRLVGLRFFEIVLKAHTVI